MVTGFRVGLLSSEMGYCIQSWVAEFRNGLLGSELGCRVQRWVLVSELGCSVQRSVTGFTVSMLDSELVYCVQSWGAEFKDGLLGSELAC